MPRQFWALLLTSTWLGGSYTDGWHQQLRSLRRHLQTAAATVHPTLRLSSWLTKQIGNQAAAHLWDTDHLHPANPIFRLACSALRPDGGSMSAVVAIIPAGMLGWMIINLIFITTCCTAGCWHMKWGTKHYPDSADEEEEEEEMLKPAAGGSDGPGDKARMSREIEMEEV